MGPRTDSSGRIVRDQPAAAVAKTKPGSLETLITSPQMAGQIKRALPSHMSGERMARITLTALRTTRGLSECSIPSFLGCVLQAAQLGLEPNTPLQHCWLIPRNSKHTNVQECTLMIGYQGMIELTNRSGRMASPPRAFTVREGDEFHFELGLRPNIIHRPARDPQREKRPIECVYAVARIKGSDDPMFEVLSRDAIEARRARSASPNSGPWATDYEAMAQKSAVRALWKWLPKSAEMAEAMTVEQRAEEGLTAFVPEVAQRLEGADLGLTFPADVPAGEPEPEPKKSQKRRGRPPKAKPEPVQATPPAREPEPEGVRFAEDAPTGDPEPPEPEFDGYAQPGYDPNTGEVIEREPGQEG